MNRVQIRILLLLLPEKKIEKENFSMNMHYKKINATITVIQCKENLCEGLSTKKESQREKMRRYCLPWLLQKLHPR